MARRAAAATGRHPARSGSLSNRLPRRHLFLFEALEPRRILSASTPPLPPLPLNQGDWNPGAFPAIGAAARYRLHADAGNAYAIYPWWHTKVKLLSGDGKTFIAES